MYAYHKLVSKNGSHKLTAHIGERICTYRVKKIQATILRIVIRYVLVTGNFNLHVYGVANESQFMCICNHLYVDLSPISFRCITI